jgi:ribosome-associated translation inhibitor RaiA
MRQFQITFRGMDPSEHLRALAETKFFKLSRQWGATSRCHVVIERPFVDLLHKATLFSVRVQLHVGAESIHAAAESQHTEASTALREAFERVRIQAATQSARAGRTRRGARVEPVLALR